MDLAHWVDTHAATITDQWRTAIVSRSGPWPSSIEPLLSRFLELLVSMLPGCLGPQRGHVEPIWLQATELYGSIASLRGLAAGDVIEEVQGLRESLIRRLYDRPPGDGRSVLGLREVLRLNRIVDQGVTQASVGHTDALFFALIEGSGVPAAVTPKILRELEAQVDSLAGEYASITGAADQH